MFIGLQLAIAQVNITFRNATGLTLKPDDLLSLMINSNYQGDIKANIEGYVSDEQSNKIFQFKTDFIAIHPGTNIVSASSVNITSQVYANINIQQVVTKTGSFAPGSYTFCVNLVKFEGAIIGTACGEVNLKISPPELISPYNTEHIPTELPQLMWHGPAPLTPDMLSMLHYELKIVEMYNDQPAYSAISDNPAIYFNNDVPHEFLTYQPGFHELEKGKTYVWQVSAFAGTFFLGKSEIWTFTVDTVRHNPRPKEVSGSYTILTPQFDGNFHVFKNVVRFKISDPYTYNPTTVRILNTKRENMIPAGLKVDRSYATNLYSIDFTNYNQFKNNELYFIELETDRGEILTMGFKLTIDKKHERKSSSFIHKDR
jgi:hypothetical protein